MSQTALVIGAGGIGHALAQKLRQGERYETVLSGSRRPQEQDLSCPLDFTHPASIAAFADAVAAALGSRPLDSIAICSGTLHTDDIQPERRLAALRAEAFQTVMQVNALGPLLLLQQLLPLVPRRTPSRVLVISARVGSIADNRMGGWYSYRASKAALNQGLQCLKVELQRTHPQCVLTLFHPGTVDTELSAPFQKNVPTEKLFSTERAASQLDAVMHSRNDPKAHIFVDWAGNDIVF